MRSVQFFFWRFSFGVLVLVLVLLVGRRWCEKLRKKKRLFLVGFNIRLSVLSECFTGIDCFFICGGCGSCT